MVQCQFEEQISEHVTQIWNHQSYTIYGSSPECSSNWPKSWQPDSERSKGKRSYSPGLEPVERELLGKRTDMESLCNMKQACALLRLMAARHVLFWDWLLPLLKSPNDTLSTTSGQSMRISGCSPSQESATPTQIDKKPLRIFHLLHQDMFGVRIRVRVLSPQRWSFKLAA